MMFVQKLRALALQLWNDDCGAVLTTEYLMLGSVVALGGVSGLVSVRDSMNSEMKEYGSAIRTFRQDYAAPGYRTGNAYKGGSGASNPASAGQFGGGSYLGGSTYGDGGCDVTN